MRQAFYQAIDEEAIAAKVMRGFATADRADGRARGQRLRRRRSTSASRTTRPRAKKLLAEAGYPERLRGRVRLPERPLRQRRGDLPGGGRDAGPHRRQGEPAGADPRQVFRQDHRRRTTTPASTCWAGRRGPRTRSTRSRRSRRRAGGKDGVFNVGGYSNPKLDELTKKIQVELDNDKRNELIAEALKLIKDDFAYIPLHQQMVVWASRDNVELVPAGEQLLPAAVCEDEVTASAHAEPLARFGRGCRARRGG